MDTNILLSGGCLCGAIRYEAQGEPFDADYCHCRQCQLSSGAIVMTWMDFNTTQVTWLSGQVTEYHSSESIRRGFCSSCGSSLTYRHTGYPDYQTLSIATLDQPNLVKPKYHIFTDNQAKWLNIDDQCKRYPLARS